MNFAVFDLSSVIHFDHRPIRNCLVEAIQTEFDQEISLLGLNWEDNCSGILLDVFMHNLQRFPTNQEYEAIRRNFTICLKKYFIQDDERFEVMPGVQSLFSSLDKKPNWQYAILSDYWGENTDFLLTACGIYTKSKEIHSADEGLSSIDLINRLCFKNKMNQKKDTLYLVSNRFKKRNVMYEKDKIERVLPPFSKKSKLTQYPKFSKVFN